MIEFRYTGEELWERMERAVERVNDRLRKTVQILEASGVPYAIVGGHAVRAWVAQVDIAAVRTTADVDILIRPDDFPKLRRAMEAAGFHHRQSFGIDMFVERPDASARDGIHVVLAGQKVRPSDIAPSPDVFPSEIADNFRTVPFESLVKMKLTSYRRKDQVHLLDMISVGLIDGTWPARFSGELGRRLAELLDDPNG